MQGFSYKFAVNLGFIVNNFRPAMEICIGILVLWTLGMAMNGMFFHGFSERFMENLFLDSFLKKKYTKICKIR